MATDKAILEVEEEYNFDIERFKAILQKQSIPEFNFVISMILFFSVPLVFQIVAPDHSSLGLIGGIVLLFQMIFSVLGMYGCDNRQRWALGVYKDSLLVFAVLYLLIFVLQIVVLALKDQTQYYKENYPGGIIFLVVIVLIIYFIMIFWLMISYYMAIQYVKKIDWFYDQRNEEVLRRSHNNSKGSFESKDNEDLQQQLLKQD